MTGQSSPGSVHIEYRKFDGSPYTEFRAERAGEDAFGQWFLSVPPLQMRYRPMSDAWLSIDGQGHVWLIPHDQWWTMLWRWTDDLVAVDVAMPASWEGDDHVAIVDLDIDLFRRGDGSAPPPDPQGRSTRWAPPVAVVAEELFEANARGFGYPDDVREQARTTAMALEQAMRENREPFATAYRQWYPKSLSGGA